MASASKTNSKKEASRSKKETFASTSSKQIRYAVVGLGYIAQSAVLPAFKNAAKNSELTALVSHDKEKLKKLGRQYKVKTLISYDEYDQLVRSPEIDAVYIALPNSLHRDFAVKALESGKHVLCEKPLALTAKGCRKMIDAAERNGARLMTAYRLHFEEANLSAIELIKSGKIGEPRIFNSLFTFQVNEENVRLERNLTGGSVYDLGIYCINAARHVFQSEPIEVLATSVRGSEARFDQVDEMTAATLLFPNGAIATFTCSFGAADCSTYEVIGTKGSLKVNPAFEYSEPLKHYLTIGDKTVEKKFKKVDQFAPELLYFSDCILKNREPEPSGEEGLADVRIIQAIYRSAKSGKPVVLSEFEKPNRPVLKQSIQLPSIKEPKLYRADAPSLQSIGTSVPRNSGYHEAKH